ncbi:bifunctional phosphoribosylaminoimidazolecarboxamide formyltransferase/IMP cyclohydrolase [Gardnerella vaginalis]|uniref:Bifunctional purine biosynthesis protein PurH n=2 Tax=Gardnerella vaginalis TaxID=2702 RepID=A0AAW6Y3T8_GARVA|nr:bifunctional phosphoribosylaminoimidazolecarboxamide formyltransferase/IMP cyclohydrolase [Gardnerella vaginalis]EGL13734.1 putative phosphoribosylaminoimidazolecarboxamide formyltransferase/IMP cyclohydrolase [Gardnerella vaginalis 315-A]MDK7063114.1 bifunctional phosphoribosylaminoimidazolecarboxamide formyltransferase/IMP cyclohydrolase [Gardnerella vaginalis]MDK8327432.1 bifunctional phosphoribosylaminoimidazolecarboxamide formyltransferase/IMP cyclohydrolase [Gardnerella vaginalis]NSX23
MQQIHAQESSADVLITTGKRSIKRVLVSVFCKEGLETLADSFKKCGTQVVSTGSTAAKLQELGVKVTEVSDITGFPESLDGRVKTLDPHIHAGILADMSNPDHVKQLKELNIEPFDAVVVNLYPFVNTVMSGGSEAQIIEKIDIGGPSMVRAAAKNHKSVAVITDPADYQLLANRIVSGEGFNLQEREYLAGKAFAHTAAYDASISEWTSKAWKKPESLNTNAEEDSQNTGDVELPANYTRTWSLEHKLRYGENPHQQAGLYLDPLHKGGLAQAELLGGKPMSYNNYVDADAAWRAVWDFAPQIAVAVCKHNNPCGLAIGATAAIAHKKAHACDPVSAYGGVIACNSTVTLEMAESVRPIFTEVIIAPDYEPEALELLRTKKKNLRILKVANPPVLGLQVHPIDGGALVQSADKIDDFGDNPQNWTLVSGEAADTDTLRDLEFAWRSLRCVKSNAILLAHDNATVGIGMGQVNRVDSCHLAVERANTLADGVERARGAVAASDAFFPFADGPQILIDAGVRAIVQPGGSIRDVEVFEAARAAGVTMYTTGTRHFFH